MADRTFLSWPFFEPRHRDLAERLDQWCSENIGAHGSDLDAECRRLVNALGQAGFLKLSVADSKHRPDVRSLAIARETLAYHSGLADFAFAMQGLGSGAISLFGTIEQKREWLPRVASGEAIAAFAMTEPDCGSDAANMSTSAMRDGNEWVLVGEKSYISNGGIADFYVTFARTGEGEGARGLSAFIVPADAVDVAERIEVIAPHPLARLKYDNVRIPADAIIGEPGEGFRIGMETLNLFRVTVGAAALGFAQRALDEALEFACNRPPRHVGQDRRDEHGDRCLGPADLSGCVGTGHRRSASEAVRGARQAPRDRGRAAGDRRGGADARRRWGHARRQGRGALSRHSRASHLRRRERGAAADHRARSSERGAVVNKREIAKAVGFMLLGSAITIALIVIWFSIAFRAGFPT